MDARYERYLKKAVIETEMEMKDLEVIINESVERLVELERILRNDKETLERAEKMKLVA